jgi:hypothetical protein
VLVILQGMDASGKDGIIKHVMAGINPQGCEVHSFKEPSAEELDHDFFWRSARALPARGRIGIFNRSYYEEVLVARVHPEILANEKLPEAVVTPRIWQQRFDDIRAFERTLAHNGTLVLKFFLHISREEQRERFLARIEEPAKRWKFSMNDVTERRRWDRYMRAYEEMIRATSHADGAGTWSRPITSRSPAWSSPAPWSTRWTGSISRSRRSRARRCGASTRRARRCWRRSHQESVRASRGADVPPDRRSLGRQPTARTTSRTA